MEDSIDDTVSDCDHFNPYAVAATVPRNEKETIAELLNQGYRIVGKDDKTMYTNIQDYQDEQETGDDDDGLILVPLCRILENPPDDLEKKITIHVQFLTPKTVTLTDVAIADSVEKLRTRIQDKEGIPPEQQVLIFDGKRLVDQDYLWQYGIEDGSTIHIVRNLRGGSSRPQVDSIDDSTAQVSSPHPYSGRFENKPVPLPVWRLNDFAGCDCSFEIRPHLCSPRVTLGLKPSYEPATVGGGLPRLTIAATVSFRVDEKNMKDEEYHRGFFIERVTLQLEPTTADARLYHISVQSETTLTVGETFTVAGGADIKKDVGARMDVTSSVQKQGEVRGWVIASQERGNAARWEAARGRWDDHQQPPVVYNQQYPNRIRFSSVIPRVSKMNAFDTLSSWEMPSNGFKCGLKMKVYIAVHMREMKRRPLPQVAVPNCFLCILPKTSHLHEIEGDVTIIM